MKKLAMFLGMAWVILTVTTMADADMVFSNYDEASGYWDAWNDSWSPPERVEPFTTAGNALGQWELTQITLSADSNVAGGPSQPVTISIYADDSGSAGTAVASWDLNMPDTNYGDWSFSATAVTLDALEAYWLGVEPTHSDGSLVGWQWTTNAASHVFEIAGDPIPEPVTMILLCGGAVPVLLSYRRKRRT
ncbi:MAG: PEP-CTERM sorting domain-containing protein [Phycisphaerae bacterium]|nr:PEP-CTERM sorting domain-containing protein [Phycisphaerae bacterium]